MTTSITYTQCSDNAYRFNAFETIDRSKTHLPLGSIIKKVTDEEWKQLNTLADRVDELINSCNLLQITIGQLEAAINQRFKTIFPEEEVKKSTQSTLGNVRLGTAAGSLVSAATATALGVMSGGVTWGATGASAAATWCYSSYSSASSKEKTLQEVENKVSLFSQRTISYANTIPKDEIQQAVEAIAAKYRNSEEVYTPITTLLGSFRTVYPDFFRLQEIKAFAEELLKDLTEHETKLSSAIVKNTVRDTFTDGIVNCKDYLLEKIRGKRSESSEPADTKSSKNGSPPSNSAKKQRTDKKK